MSLAAGSEPSLESGQPADAAAPHRDALIEELERRILELDDHDEPEFGGFSVIDWLILVLFAVVVPVLLVIRFAP